MAYFANRDFNRLTAQTLLQELSWGFYQVFSSAYLLALGISPAVIFLAQGACLAVRFVVRFATLAITPRLGARRAFILGLLILTPTPLLLGTVSGVGLPLFAYFFVIAVGDAFAWPCYHGFTAALGDAESRGRQLAGRQLALAAARIAGPAAGGLMLAGAGPWVAFGCGTALRLLAIIPVLGLTDLPMAPTSPAEAARAARRCLVPFALDAWITCATAFAWDLITFRALAERFDAMGGVLAVAALAGAFGGVIFGRFIDLGHGRRAAWISASAVVGVVLLKAAVGNAPGPVVAATLVANALGGLYVPALFTTIYNEAKRSPCAFRFHFGLEAGWDLGGVALALSGAALLAVHVPLQAILLLAIPAIIVQSVILSRRYAEEGWELASAGDRLTEI
jgi:MFS family permease